MESSDTRLSTRSMVNLRLLKQFAAEKLKPKSVLRHVLLLEKDKIQPAEFLIKSEIWLELLKLRGDQ